LALAAVCVCFARLGSERIWILNEAREGLFARSMLESGNFVLPQVSNHVENGVRIPDKPPLLHWIDDGERWLRSLPRGATSGRELARDFDVFDLRFGSALAGVVCVLALYLLGRGLLGQRAALLGALTLLGCAQFQHQSHFGRVDMCLTTCVTLALLCAGRALLRPSRAALLWAAVASGFAVLAKGPLGLVLPAVAVGSYMVLRSLRERGAGWSPRLPWLRALLVWALVALPWYLCAWKIGGQDFVRSQLLNENVAQFGGANGRMEWTTYLGPWLTDTFPWNLIALAGVWRAWRERHEGALFASVWWISCLFVFQVAAYKRRAYLLPAVPAEALLAGFALDGWLARARAAGLAGKRLAALASGGAVLGAALGAWFDEHGPQLRVSGAEGGAFDSVLGCAAIGVVLGSIAALVLALREGRRAAALAALLLASSAAASGVLPVEGIARARAAGIPEFARRIEAELPDGATITLIGVGDDPSMVLLFAVREPWRWSVVPDAAPPLAEHAPGWYLVTQREAAALAAGAQKNGESWREVLRGELRERGNRRDLVLLERMR
jgi:4-amino-4-deoxy-L-arabinose transferase-like glycosyltransferase